MSQHSLFPFAEPVMGDIERAASAQGQRWIVGVDEAGRGPLAGPVHAAAVVLDMEALTQDWILRLNDSKQLKESVRESLFDLIKAGAIGWAIASRDERVIDEINILEATRQAMREAILGAIAMADKPVERVYIDGKQYLDLELDQTCVVKGDARSYHIAAASVLAKVARDREMLGHHARWPEYGFEQHKGYGTKAHREAIAAHGPCPLHRLSFGGVKEHVSKLRQPEG